MKNNLNVFKKSNFKNRLCALSLVSILALTGCGSSDKKEGSNAKTRRALIEVDGQLFDLEVTDCTRWYDSVSYDIRLKDGTRLFVGTDDCQLYDANSSVINSSKENLTIINCDIDDLQAKNINQLNMALVEVNGEIFDLEITDYTRWYDSMSYPITLKDGTEFIVSADDCILYNSDSPIMNKVEEQVLAKKLK